MAKDQEEAAAMLGGMSGEILEEIPVIAELDDFFSIVAPAFKFETPGDEIRGQIVGVTKPVQATDPDTNQPSVTRKGNPVNQVVITLQTDLSEDEEDDGRRSLYVQQWRMRNAITDALRAIRVSPRHMVGTWVKVTFTEEGEPPGKKMSAPMLFTAKAGHKEADIA